MQADQKGTINVLVIPLVLVSLFLVGVGILAIWAFNSRQDYKNNTEQKIAAAVIVAKQETQTADAEQYAQSAKYPLKSYVGPQEYGNIVIKYPKTWAAYVDEEDGSGTPISGYFEPNFVPSITSQSSVFALQLQVLQEPYDQALVSYTSLATAGQVSIKTYKATNVSSAIGVYISGQIQPNIEGEMVVLPLRTYTIELWTESSQYESDFNNIILPNFSFSP